MSLPRRYTWLFLLAIFSFMFLVPSGAGGRGVTPAIARASVTIAAERPAAHPTLFVYNTVQGLLAGDLTHAVTVARVGDDLSAFPPDWVTLGVGTTNWEQRTGELMPDGTAGNLHFWWADPDGIPAGSLADVAVMSPAGAVYFPFLALGVADPSSALTWPVDGIGDLHAWLNARLQEANIRLAAVQVEGTFGQVNTTVSYNLPSTGVDLSGGYTGDEYFRFGSYPSGSWVMNGVYALPPALQPVVSTAGNPLHLHGYQPQAMVGGHIVSAAAVHATARVWPLERLIELPAPLGP